MLIMWNVSQRYNSYAIFLMPADTAKISTANLWDTLCIPRNMDMGSYQIRKFLDCACARNAGNVFPPPRVSDPDMNHGTCVTHVPWCMPGSLTSGFLRSRWRGKHSRHSLRMRNTQFPTSGKSQWLPLCYALLWFGSLVSVDFTLFI